MGQCGEYVGPGWQGTSWRKPDGGKQEMECHWADVPQVVSQQEGCACAVSGCVAVAVLAIGFVLHIFGTGCVDGGRQMAGPARTQQEEVSLVLRMTLIILPVSCGVCERC